MAEASVVFVVKTTANQERSVANMIAMVARIVRMIVAKIG